MFTFRNLLLVGIVWIIGCSSYAQKSIADSTISFGIIGVGYGFYIPQGDLAQRFGPHFLLSLNGGYKLRNNIEFDISANYLFGERVKEIPALELANAYGLFIGRYGDMVAPRFNERGAVFYFSFMKIFNKLFSFPNPNSGPFVSVGGGYMYHRINVNAPDLLYLSDKDFYRGYDRLSGGPGFLLKIGYALHSNSQYFNLRAALEGYAFFTQSLRKYQYDKGEFNENRNDFFVGVSLEWLFLIYRQAPNKEYYY